MMLFYTLHHKIFLWRLLKENPGGDNPPEQKLAGDSLTDQLTTNLATIQKEFATSPDVIIRRFKIGSSREAALVYIDGLVEKERIEEGILRPLLEDVDKTEKTSIKNLSGYVQSKLTTGEIKNETAVSSVIGSILSGDTVLLVDGMNEALLIEARGGKSRPIKEPDREVVIKGSHVGFIESLGTNIALLRRKVRDPKLTLEIIRLGRRTRTEVAIAYLKGIASPGLVEEIRKRLKRIDNDAILDSGPIEEFIQDNPLSPFPTTAYTERPDVVAAKILEGRAAILIDGTPVALTVPMLFMERFQRPDDYNFNFYYASIIRWLRFTAYLITVLAPALYVALFSYHPELIPTPLLINMAAAAEGTPFPAIAEALGMGVIVELLREAGRWMTGSAGPIVNVLGLLVIGQALISSGLVGAPFVIVVAVTLVTSLVVPTQEDINPLLRIFFVLLSGVLGLYGLILGFIIIYIHLAFLRSFGAPYLAPITPWNPDDAQDILVRAPWWAMRSRPTLIGREDRTRQGDSLKPHPPENEG